MSPWLAVGLILNSALYLVSVFAAGLVWHNTVAVCTAIVAMGLTYLCYAAQIMLPKIKPLGPSLVGASVIAGLLAGLQLL